MAVPYKVTYFFEGLQQGRIGTGASVGWTESWYKESDQTIEEALMDTDHQIYINARRKVLSRQYRLSFLRVSQDNQPRRFKIRSIGNSFGTAEGSTFTGALSQVQCAVLVDLEKLPAPDQPLERVHHRRFLIRGLPSALIDGNVLNTAAPAWNDLENFLDFIGNKEAGSVHPVGHPRYTWGIRYNSPLTIKIPINSIDVTGTNTRAIDVTLNGGPYVFARGDKIVITGIETPERFNRTWTFLVSNVVAGVTLYTLGQTRKRLFGSYVGPGTGVAYKAIYRYGPIDQYAIIGLRNKKTGRAFRQARGRSARR